VIACKWSGRKSKVLGLVGVGTMGLNALRCLLTLYRFDEIRCTSRRPETRQAFADEWSKKLGIRPSQGHDRGRGARRRHRGRRHHLGRVVSREPWLKPGCTFISLARRELDPAGWAKMDKVVVDSWSQHAPARVRRTVESGLFRARSSMARSRSWSPAPRRAASATMSGF